ncbi:MAG: Smr/MutS family protein [Myxococcales bacterium]|nr:Smr/MutS family protein [Myxococcales bacterium]
MRALGPLPTRQVILEALDATDEMLALEEEGVNLPIGAVTDARGAVRRAEKGQVLEGSELLSAARAMAALIEVGAVLDRRAEEAPVLARWAAEIELDGIIVDDVVGSFDPSGRLSGSRYPELDELRKGIANLHGEVRATLDRLVKGQDLGDELLQDRYWTVRDDRYVLPIKSHAKRWDLGIVHGTSGTGRTVFVEPHAVVQLNNQLRLAEGRLLAAEHAILTQLSTEIGTQADALELATEAAITLDVTAARAGLCRSLKATRPRVGEGDRIDVTKARHPVLVLRGVEVVANDLSVDATHPVLILSGPNAGGKTVALKTLGLCAELVRHGCHVPAAEDSRVDRFDRILASIGDNQTVEGDLSSFSAHLVTLKGMVDQVGPGQLLLLDEVASGTDPAQGAALAQALCEHLATLGPRLVVTTHFAALKAMGAAHPKFQVAAVQYAQGKPTYRVLMGATGESHALDIAGRVGLPAEVITRAEAVLGEEQAEMSRLLSALEAERTKAEAARAEVDRLAREAAARAASLAEREAKVKARAKELEAEAAAAFTERLKAAEKAIGQVVAELQRSPSHKGAEAARATVAALSGVLPTPEAEAPPPAEPAPLKVGDHVRLRSARGSGEIVGLSGSTAQVRVGGLTVKAKLSDLVLTHGPPPERRPAAAAAITRASRSSALSDAVRVGANTLDMRGMRVDEGQDAAEAFFDKAVRGGWDTVFLLHGHGTGALKEGLRGWLRSCGYVSDWVPAGEDQGGDAFTVVQLS